MDLPHALCSLRSSLPFLLFSSFSPRSNLHLLSHYGFLLDGNPNLEGSITLRVPLHWPGMEEGDESSARLLRSQKLRTLKLIAPDSDWSDSTDIHSTTHRASASGVRLNDTLDVFRCVLHNHPEFDHFSVCLGMARLSVASPLELLRLFTATLPNLPAIGGGGQQPPIGWANELRALDLLASAAKERIERMERALPGEEEMLARHVEGVKAGRCKPQADTAGSSSGCLSHAQWMMLRVCADERLMLHMQLQLRDAAHQLAQRPPGRHGDVDGWLRMQRPDLTADHPVAVYTKHVLVPLWRKHAFGGDDDA